jgi:hypothetical protein
MQLSRYIEHVHLTFLLAPYVIVRLLVLSRIICTHIRCDRWQDK